MRAEAEIVIIGGGAIGCSIAYHLARLGKRDVVLLEKSGITHGSTWHAAGLVGQLRSKRNLTRMLQYSVELYGRLEAETGQATDWKPVGSLRLASSQARWQEIKRTATTARSFGFELHLLSPREALDLFPLMNPDGVVGAAFIPSDGYVDPSSLTQALAKGARDGGVEISEGVLVTDIEVSGRRAAAVVTDHGTIRTDCVVNAAGIWAGEIGALAGVAVPAGAVEHQYLVTERVAEAPADLPTLRDPDKNFYLKPEVNGIAMGGWEPDTVPFGSGGIPAGFGRELLTSNFDRFEQIARRAAERLPLFDEVGIRNLINGPIPVSPDGEPVMGKVPELDNYFVACGFSAGIAGCGGAGRALAQWLVEGDPGMDLWAFDVRRFGAHHAGRRYLDERCVESYGGYYKIHWPGEEAASGRGGRRSPLYPLLKEKGAVFGSKLGWERPNWFDAEGKGSKPPSFERPQGFDLIGEEHRAVREAAALIDQSSFAKLEVTGPGAFAFLQGLAANDLDQAPGSVVYSQLCNERGGVEADLTISRLAEDRFYVVTGSGFAVRDLGWIRRHAPEDGSVTLTDVTSAKAVLNLCGPRAREILMAVTDQDVDNQAFPFMQARSLEIGYAPVLALRVSYTGELGWELHVPSDYAAHLYEILWRAGADLGLRDAGYRALESLRLEKGYRYWGAELTPDYSPFEAGLGFCVALDKGPFKGREALARIKQEGCAQRLGCFALDRPKAVYGGEAILHQGKAVGVTTSAGFGYSVGRHIAYGYIPAELGDEDGFEIEAFCEAVPATRHDGALYDPRRTRILA